MLLALVAVLGGCLPARPPVSALAAGAYADPAMWLCRPDLARGEDACRGVDLTATEIRHDGSRARVVTAESTGGARERSVDCFYVYPTVDLSLRTANHEDLADDDELRRVTLAQAARFREVCNVYAPKYRQITIGTYLRSEAGRAAYLDAAFADVRAAWDEYRAHHDRGRPLVIFGHSQGAEMAARLLKAVFDDDPAMRARLLVGMPIGGRVEVPVGRDVGGTFAHLPLCRSATQTGCIVAYRSYAGGTHVAASEWLPGRGLESACTNPADLAGDGRYHLVSRSYFPAHERAGFVDVPHGVDTPFVMVRRFFSARCETAQRGNRYLAIQTAPASARDPRLALLDLSVWRRQQAFGMHIFDVHLPQGALIDLVRARMAAAATRRPTPGR